MRRYIQSFTVIMGMAFLVLFAAGPREERDSYTEMVEGHNAFKLFKDGVWEIRYISHMVEYTDRIKSTTVRLSVNMNRELSEEEMLGIMDYYELTRNCKFVGNEYVGERETKCRQQMRRKIIFRIRKYLLPQRILVSGLKFLRGFS